MYISREMIQSPLLVRSTQDTVRHWHDLLTFSLLVCGVCGAQSEATRPAGLVSRGGHFSGVKKWWETLTTHKNEVVYHNYT